MSGEKYRLLCDFLFNVFYLSKIIMNHYEVDIQVVLAVPLK